MSDLSDIDLVIFDCDGVLVDSEVLAAEAVRRLLAAEGIEVTTAMLAGCVGMKQADVIAKLEAETGRVIGPLLADGLWPATKTLFSTHLTSTGGLAGFLDALPYRRCVASSSSHERIAFSLGVTGIDRYFPRDAIFSSSEVAHGKPAPDLFLHAAARMGVPPARCLVIEDSRFGVIGAVAAGMAALGFVGGSHAGPETAAALLDNGASWVEAGWPAVAARLGVTLPAAADTASVAAPPGNGHS